ncbi:hypothetical protein Tco_0992985 [Tanacetum coccineum]|uniref:Uncharacterized protein n=1 Tax=Tanacetum coccineum TaxID=301880 RepID=A0ABQ5F3M5_9ASTR
MLSLQKNPNISQALQDENWVEAMQEELLQFKLQKVWILVDLPSGKKEGGNQRRSPRAWYETLLSFLMEMFLERPDIMFAVCACARFQVTPKASHLNAVKRIFRTFFTPMEVLYPHNSTLSELQEDSMGSIQ